MTTRAQRCTAGLAAAIMIAASGAASGQDPAVRALSQDREPACQHSETYLDPDVPRAGSFEPRNLETGWLAGNLIGQSVTDSTGDTIGEVNDILVGPDQVITGLSIETASFLGLGERHFTIPWKRVDLTPNRKGIATSVSPAQTEQIQPGSSARSVSVAGEEFRVSDILGDRTRIGSRTTPCHQQRGSIEDVVFDRQARLVAIIEHRSEDLGGGYYAYPFLSYESGWRPFYGYYDLLLENVDEPALRVDLGRFELRPETAG